MGFPRPRRSIRTWVFVCALTFSLGSTAFPQSPIAGPGAAPPAHVAFVDGSATLERDGLAEFAGAGLPFVTGDRLRTAVGRVEVLFPDGAALYVDEHSVVDLLSPSVLRLSSGRAILIVPREADQGAAVRYQIDTPFTAMTTGGAGTYRADAERAYRWSDADAFDRWANDRYEDQARARSAQYLPQDLRVYGRTFDRHGSWHYNPPHGYVWYPAVARGWRPYYNGHWAPVQPYGWTWIGVDAWSWPTDHYGRWGFRQGGWFWIPGRTWAPGWVTWAAAADYVGWCPLGFDGRPVFALTLGGGAWNGWVVVPRTAFGARGYYAHRHAIDPRRLSPATPFVQHAQAPIAAPRFARSPADPQSPRYVDRAGLVARPRAPSRDFLAAPNDSRMPIRTPQAVPRHASPQTVPRYGSPPAVPRYGFETPESPAAPPLTAPAAPRYGHRTPASPVAAPVATPAVPRYGNWPRNDSIAAPSAVPQWRAPAAAPPRPAVVAPPAGGTMRMPGTWPTPLPAAPGVAVPRHGPPQPAASAPASSRQAGEGSGSQSSGRAHAPHSRHPR